jgi:fibronectin type 3 domain-containing protein
VNTSGLATGTQTGTITVSATGALPKTIAVTLTVNAPMTSSAALTWNSNTDVDLAGYKIYRSTASGTYGAALATVPAGTVTYLATGLTANTTYFFVITAYDTAGNESLFSNEVSKSIF